MCGIVGYAGPDEALPIIIEGLRRLEYRGYDSAGIAVLNGGLDVVKRAGKLASLEAALADEGSVTGSIGMGHTRWATHGAPTDRNAHPHQDCTRQGRRDPQRHHRELPRAPRPVGEGRAHADVRDRHRVHRPRHRRAAGRRRHLARRTRCGEPSASSKARTRSSCVRSMTPRCWSASGCPPRWWWGSVTGRRCWPPTCLGGAGPHHDRDPGRGGAGRRGPPGRRRVHRLRRTGAAPRADHGGLGRRPGAEGRLRLVHAQGDRRTARRDPRHARGAGGRWPAGARRAPHQRRRAPRGEQGVRRGLRHGVPLGHGREVRDRALDPFARRDRDRERVPLPRPGPWSRHADAGGVAERRDDRHLGGGAARAPAGFAGDRGDEHRGVVAGARGRRRALHARGHRDLRRRHEDLRDADGVAIPGGPLPGPGAGLDVPRGDRRGPRPSRRAAGRGAARDRARRPMPRPGRTLRRRARPCSSSGDTPATRPRSKVRSS